MEEDWGYLVVNVLFVYRIIISEFCRIGKWGNDGWIGRRIFGIKLGIVEFFGGFGGGFVGEVGDWEFGWEFVWEVEIIFPMDYVMTKSDIGLIKFRNEKGEILQYYFYFENGDSANLEGEEVYELEDLFKKSSSISIAIVDYKNRTWNYKFDATGFTKALNSIR
jgi:hypothetical protein